MKRLLYMALVLLMLLCGCQQTAGSPSQEGSPAASPSMEGSPSPDPVITEIDHYVLKPDARASIPENIEAYYRQLVDALLNQEESVRLSDDYDENLYVGYLLQQNPFYFLLEDLSYSSDHSTILLTYEYDAQAHEEIITYMDGEYLNILNTVIQPEYNELEQVLAVYQYFSSRIEYNFEWVGEMLAAEERFLFPSIEIYEALTTNLGVCHSYAYLCEYAFQQLGIDSFCQFGDMVSSDEGHMWLLVKIDGIFYHCDPTWDKGYGEQVGLRYFGMTDEERAAGGVENFSSLMVHDIEYEQIFCTDETFSVFRDVVDFSFGENHTLILQTEYGEEKVFDTVSKKLV